MPPFTVASLATIMHSTPDTRPMPAITDAAARAFTLLRGRVAQTLTAAGVDAAAAATRASFTVSAIEGALLQARAERSAQPLRDVEAELTRYLS